ncbi:hypothetical protein [Streptomyces mirabilis]
MNGAIISRAGLLGLTTSPTDHPSLMLDAAPSHVERLDDGTEVKLGLFLSNTESRRAKLSTDKLQVLADLGLEWAVAWHRATVDLTMAGFGPPPFTATR